MRALLAGGHDVALQALFRNAGLAAATHGVILRALKVWREVANGKRVAGVQEVSWLMLKELGGQSAEGDLAGLVKSISSRGAARERTRPCAGDRGGIGWTLDPTLRERNPESPRSPQQ